MKWIAVLTLALLAAPLAAIEPKEVLVIYNSRADGSQEIAEYYAALRGIPTDRILKLTTGTEEEISREEFNKDIWPQVQEFIKNHPETLAIVPCRGVPLKIREFKTDDDVDPAKDINKFIPSHDFASVDDELTLARVVEKMEVADAVQNPYADFPNHASDQPLTREIGILAVSRLDGPTVEIAKGLVDKAIVAEALVPEGENYLDTGTSNPGYKTRDIEMAQIADIFKQFGVPINHDTKPEVQDLSTFREPLHYFGWYAGGPTCKGKVKFRTGSVAAHLHSFGAATVRNAGANWVGPLLSWNCTCTYGTVYEPLTVGFPYERILFHRLLKGYCWGEAGQMANHLLSWQSVFCGDPLYTPYARKWKERKGVNRKALTAMLASGGKEMGEAKPEEKDLAVIEAAYKIIQGRLDAIVELQRKDPRAGVASFMEFLFFVRGFELESGMARQLEPFADDMKRQWTEMKAALKANPVDTRDYEIALETWIGQPIHAELIEYRAELAKVQEKLAAPLVKKAESAVKGKKYLDAWQFAHKAELHKFSTSASVGTKIREGIEKDADQRLKLYEDANKELKRMHTTAKKDLDKGAYQKAYDALCKIKDEYPDCTERAVAEDILKQAEAKLPKK
ncbi:MAG: TIGR03790 family protein [Planctomycetes bacterium]|nr:TIGR03790 family protein [Planctomycetota bacterium]